MTSEETDSDPQIRSIQVNKQLELEYDIGNLLASDPNEVDAKKLKSSNPNKYLMSLARDNTQLLINKIWTLPFERVDDVVITKLPAPQYLLPREKPLPKAKQMTKWEQYAKDKGIKKKTKTKLVWDDLVKGWVPRYGYRRAAAEHEKDWVLEVPANADPFEDQFEKKSEAKGERVAKNELQRLKNIARSRKVQVPTTGITPTTGKLDKTELNRAAHVAKQATASLGKFQEKLPNEKPLKKTGKKRKFEPLVQADGKEKNMNMDVLDKVLHKKPLLDVEKVVNKGLQKDREENTDGFDDSGKTRGKRGSKGQKNTKAKRGSVRKGGFKKGRAAPRSKPKKKKH